MTTAHTLQRSLIVGLASLAFVSAFASSASAETSSIPADAVVVSSTVWGSGSFTMTATNLGEAAIDLDLAAPGDVLRVSVDLGSYNDRWTINGLDSGVSATMTGALRG